MVSSANLGPRAARGTGGSRSIPALISVDYVGIDAHAHLLAVNVPDRFPAVSSHGLTLYCWQDDFSQTAPLEDLGEFGARLTAALSVKFSDNRKGFQPQTEDGRYEQNMGRKKKINISVPEFPKLNKPESGGVSVCINLVLFYSQIQWE
ncbi:unnamed protein product [Pleuronectes platessa]|uniref:Uncharacterized protein n=1 Tax=Pleuronectes platessa TaxID=8262 RepID=A0A9N7V7R1_PLEPL|nr:unnamed protein product [Pleuronectes platessa]